MKTPFPMILRAFAFCTLAIAFPVVAGAQSGSGGWNAVQSGDATIRPFLEQFTSYKDAATTAGLNASTTNNIVANYDVSSGTSVAAGSISQPDVPRTLAVQLKEASGSSMYGTVTVKGMNQFFQPISDVLTFTGGTQYVCTYNAYARITSISYSLTNNAANDKLRIATGPTYGIPVRMQNPTPRVTPIVFVADSDTTPTVADSGTWSYIYSTYKPSTTVTAPITITANGFSDGISDPPAQASRTANATGHNSGF